VCGRKVRREFGQRARPRDRGRVAIAGHYTATSCPPAANGCMRSVGEIGAALFWKPVQRVAKLHNKRPECADGDKDCEEVRPSAQAKTVTDHDLLTVPVELVCCGIDA